METEQVTNHISSDLYHYLVGVFMGLGGLDKVYPGPALPDSETLAQAQPLYQLGWAEPGFFINFVGIQAIIWTN